VSAPAISRRRPGVARVTGGTPARRSPSVVRRVRSVKVAAPPSPPPRRHRHQLPTSASSTSSFSDTGELKDRAQVDEPVLWSWTVTNCGAPPPVSTARPAGSVVWMQVTQRERTCRYFSPSRPDPHRGSSVVIRARKVGTRATRAPLALDLIAPTNYTSRTTLDSSSTWVSGGRKPTSVQSTGPRRSRCGTRQNGGPHTDRTRGASGACRLAGVRTTRSATGDSRHPGPRTPSTPPLSATAPSARPSSISHASSPVRAVPGLLHRAQPQRARSEHIGAHDDLHHGAARCRRS
jgi:hypothetical protein